MAETANTKPGNEHSAEAREIEAQLKKMGEKASQFAGNLKNMRGDELSALKAKIHRFMEDARENGADYVREAGAKAQEKLSCVGEDLTHKVRANPLTSVAIAAGIGFVLALLAKK